MLCSLDDLPAKRAALHSPRPQLWPSRYSAARPAPRHCPRSSLFHDVWVGVSVGGRECGGGNEKMRRGHAEDRLTRSRNRRVLELPGLDTRRKGPTVISFSYSVSIVNAFLLRTPYNKNTQTSRGPFSTSNVGLSFSASPDDLLHALHHPPHPPHTHPTQHNTAGTWRRAR